MKARYILKKVKIRIHKTVIRLTVVKDAETWTVSERTTTILATWERKTLRKALYVLHRAI
jgi:hypothetical protein